MQTLKAALAFAFLVGPTAYATSIHTACSDATGEVRVIDGNVTIVDGIGDVGPAKSDILIYEVSEKTENCVEGPNYVYTRTTVNEITYDIEENVQDTVTVLCLQVQTGIDNSCQ